MDGVPQPAGFTGAAAAPAHATGGDLARVLPHNLLYAPERARECGVDISENGAPGRCGPANNSCAVWRAPCPWCRAVRPRRDGTQRLSLRERRPTATRRGHAARCSSTRTGAGRLPHVAGTSRHRMQTIVDGGWSRPNAAMRALATATAVIGGRLLRITVPPDARRARRARHCDSSRMSDSTSVIAALTRELTTTPNDVRRTSTWTRGGLRRLQPFQIG